MRLIPNSDKRVNPDAFEYRHMTAAEIRALPYGAHPEVILNSGRVGTVKVNGAVKTWKRDPARFEIPVKWGLYECARFDQDEALQRFVVRVG